jgi:hypothetical protein
MLVTDPAAQAPRQAPVRLILNVRHSRPKMQLERCSDQKTRSLDAFYGEISRSDHQVSAEIGRTMIELIAALRSNPDPRQAWGLTSHYSLSLRSKDTYTSPSFVIVSVLNQKNYFIEYRIPDSGAPWPGAYMKGEAHSLEDAIRMILIAMNNSEGWSRS